MKTIVFSQEEYISSASAYISEQLLERAENIVLIDPDILVLGVFSEAIKESLFPDNKSLTLFTAKELGAPAEKFYRNLLEEYFPGTNDEEFDTFFLSAGNFTGYDDDIKAKGILSLAVLSLTDNSSIAFNEPSSAYLSGTRSVPAVDDILNSAAASGADISVIPEKAFTIGIKTIMEAQKIIVLASGESKAKAVHKMLYARTDSAVTSAFLQLHNDVTVLVDREAAIYI